MKKCYRKRKDHIILKSTSKCTAYSGSGMSILEHSFNWHFPQTLLHGYPPLRQPQCNVEQSLLQLHPIILSNESGAGS